VPDARVAEGQQGGAEGVGAAAREAESEDLHWSVGGAGAVRWLG
jgi:hypothetical protein